MTEAFAPFRMGTAFTGTNGVDSVFVRAISSVLLFVSAATCCARTYIVFRYDDFAGDEPETRAEDGLRRQVWQAEQEMDSLFAEHNVPYVAAIIPRPVAPYSAHSASGKPVFSENDGEKVEFIRRGVAQGRIEVAQHGFSHINHCGLRERPAEFRNRGYDAQLRDIVEGRDILLRACGLAEISIFVPPWNGWDDDTGRAVQQAGFKILSADRHFYYPALGKLKMAPFTAGPEQLESLLGEGTLPQNGVMVVLFHPFELVKFSGQWGDYYFGLERLGNLLARITATDGLKVVSMSELTGIEDMGVERYRKANGLWKLRAFWGRLLPAEMTPGRGGEDFYLSAEEYSSLGRYWKLLTGLFVAGVLLAGAAARYLLGLVASRRARLVIDILATIGFFVFVAAELRLVQRGYHFTGMRAIPLIFAAAFVVGLGMRVFREIEVRRMIRESQ